MSQDNVELVRAVFASVTIPGDPEPIIAVSDPGFEMHLVGVGGEPVYYEGASGIREFFRDVAEDWETFRFEGTDFRDLGDRVVVLGDVRGRGRASGVQVEDRWGLIVELKAGTAMSLHGYLDERGALDAAGLTE